MTSRQTTQAGFSLVETLVAITILLIVVTGPLTISMSTARSTSFASEQVQAFFLAQEGAELAQKARDELLLEGIDDTPPDNLWDEFSNDTAGAIYENCFKTTGCGLSFKEGTTAEVEDGVLTVTDCATGNNCKLYYNESAVRSKYTYDSANAVATPFTRVVRFEKTVGADWDVKVISKVTWRTGSIRKQQEVFVETHLFDVYETP